MELLEFDWAFESSGQRLQHASTQNWLRVRNDNCHRYKDQKNNYAKPGNPAPNGSDCGIPGWALDVL
jgi:hypothetical protein